MNPTLKLSDFRFIYMYLGRDAPIVKESIDLEAAQEAAELEQEKAHGLTAGARIPVCSSVVDPGRQSGQT